MNTFQILKNIFFLSIILLSLSCSGDKQKQVANTPNETEGEIIHVGDGEFTIKNISQNRDMAQYEQGGYFNCSNLVPKGTPQCDKDKVRDFIQQHWTEKKQGYIRVRLDGYDVASTSHIFIEPNEEGEWVIAWRRVCHPCTPIDPGKQKIIDDTLGIVSVEKVEDDTGKGDSKLAFKDKSGKLLFYF